MKIKFCILFISINISLSCNLSTEVYKEGKTSYDSLCAPCHGDQGEGFGLLYPGLKDTLYIRKNRNQITCWLIYGIGPENYNAKNTRYSGQPMFPIKNLSNIEISNILNYLNGRFWHFPEFTLSEIESDRKNCKPQLTN